MGVVRTGAHSGIVIDVGPQTGACRSWALAKSTWLYCRTIIMTMLVILKTHSGVELFPLHFWIRSSNQSRGSAGSVGS